MENFVNIFKKNSSSVSIKVDWGRVGQQFDNMYLKVLPKYRRFNKKPVYIKEACVRVLSLTTKLSIYCLILDNVRGGIL